jgi:L-lysine 2,3-aminomutase
MNTNLTQVHDVRLHNGLAQSFHLLQSIVAVARRSPQGQLILENAICAEFCQSCLRLIVIQERNERTSMRSSRSKATHWSHQA